MLTLVFIAFGFIVAIVLMLAGTRPDTFRVARTTRIAAPPDTIFPLIDDLRRGEDWSPFYRKEMQSTYGGPPRGAGATLDFAGKRNVGKGRLSITDSAAPRAVTMRLEMTEPMACDNVIRFTLEPRDAATDVTWAMEGRVPFVAKILHLVMDVDRMVGRDFETGLANLKRLAESGATAAAAPV